jgi:uncharacterized alpha-E superfamily protein
MLSSTADQLYWMARSLERAENTARMLNITYLASLLQAAGIDPNNEWRAMLSISGLHVDFENRYDAPNARNVLHFMTLDELNPGSIFSSIATARENARAVRGTITLEMWEALNHTWIEIQKIHERGIPDDGVAEFFEWVKERCHLSRGITHGTLLRDDAFRFVRLGSFIERADNTARILDVKYHILLPGVHEVGGVADYYQWSALLRSVSAFASYRKVYKDLIVPKQVAELLILRPDMPRSLVACMNEVKRMVQELGGPRSRELERLCGKLHADVRFDCIDEIVEQGLHEYLSSFLERIYDVGDLINTTYFWSADE